MIKHGTNRGWMAGCREHCCYRAHFNFKQRERRLRLVKGDPDPYVDLAPAREHLLKLSEYGVGPKAVAEITGMSADMIEQYRYPRPSKSSTTTMRAEASKKILSIPLRKRFFWETTSDDRLVDAHGTVRRIQAMVWMGHSFKEIADMVGSPNRSWAHNMVRRGPENWVKARLARKVKDSYDYLIVRDHPTGTTAAKYRNLAESRGYHPPGAWRNIDDPDENPDHYLGRKGQSKYN